MVLRGCAPRLQPVRLAPLLRTDDPLPCAAMAMQKSDAIPYGTVNGASKDAIYLRLPQAAQLNRLRLLALPITTLPRTNIQPTQSARC